MFSFRHTKLACLALLLGLAACRAAPAAPVPSTLAPSATSTPVAVAPPAPTATAQPATVATTAPPAPVLQVAAPPALRHAPTAAPTRPPATPTAEPRTPFSSEKFKLPMTFNFGPDWYVEDESPELVTITRKENDISVSFNIVNDAALFDPVTVSRVPFPKDFPAWLKADRDFSVAIERRVTVAGIEGVEIDATPTWRSQTAKIKRFLAVNDADIRNLVNSPEKWRFIMLDNVEGQRILILMIAPAGTFPAGVERASEILNGAALGRPARVLAEWKISMPQNIAVGFGSVWVPSHRSPNVTTRIDPGSNKIAATIGTGYRNHAALVVGDSVWTTGERNDMARIDPATNSVTARVPGEHTDLAYGFNSIWSTTRTDGVDRIDPATAKVIATIPLGGYAVDNNPEVMVTASGVWILHEDKDELIKIDPKSNTIVLRKPYKTLVEEAKAQKSVPSGKGTSFLWVGLYEGLLRIDPLTAKGVAFLPWRPEQAGLGLPTVTDDSVWLAGSNQIMRVNVATNQIDAIYVTHPGPGAPGLAFGSVWVPYEEDSLVQRLDIKP